MKPYKNQIVHYIDNMGKVVPARITSVGVRDTYDDGPLTRLEALDRSIIGWIRPHSGEGFQYRFIRDPNEMLLAAKDYKGVVIVRSDDPEDTLSQLESLWKDNCTSTLNVRDVSWWLNHDLPAFLCPNRNEVDLVRELDKANQDDIKKPVYLILKRGGEGLRAIEEEGLFPESPICDPDEAADLTPEERETRRQHFIEKTGMTPEEYRKKSDPCKDPHLSMEAAFLSHYIDEGENPLEIIHALSTRLLNIVILSSNDGISLGMSLIQDGTEWFIRDKTAEGDGWVLGGSRIRMPSPKKGPVEIRKNHYFGEAHDLGDKRYIVLKGGDTRLPEDVMVGDVFRSLSTSYSSYWMVKAILPDSVLVKTLESYGPSNPAYTAVQRVNDIPITIKAVSEFEGITLVSLEGISEDMIPHGYIKQNGLSRNLDSIVRGPSDAVVVTLQDDSDYYGVRADSPTPGPATFEFSRD